MIIADVTKPLLSVEEMMYKNHRVVFDVPNTHIENKTNGQRTEVVWEDSSPNLVVEVLETLDCDREPESVMQLTLRETGVQPSARAGPRFSLASRQAVSPESAEEETLAVKCSVCVALGQPSQAERDAHEANHLPYRSWCRHCMRGAVNELLFYGAGRR